MFVIMYPIMQYLAHIYTTHSHYFKVIFYIPKGVFNVDVFLTYLTRSVYVVDCCSILSECIQFE